MSFDRMSDSTPSPPESGSAVLRKPKEAGSQTLVEAFGGVAKKRAAKACICCRKRKVRCDVSDFGAPCSNCRFDQVGCVVKESRRNRRRSDPEVDTEWETPSETSRGKAGRRSSAKWPQDFDGANIEEASTPSFQRGFGGELHVPHLIYQMQELKASRQAKSQNLYHHQNHPTIHPQFPSSRWPQHQFNFTTIPYFQERHTSRPPLHQRQQYHQTPRPSPLHPQNSNSNSTEQLMAVLSARSYLPNPAPRIRITAADIAVTDPTILLESSGLMINHVLAENFEEAKMALLKEESSPEESKGFGGGRDGKNGMLVNGDGVGREVQVVEMAVDADVEMDSGSNPSHTKSRIQDTGSTIVEDTIIVENSDDHGNHDNNESKIANVEPCTDRQDIEVVDMVLDPTLTSLGEEGFENLLREVIDTDILSPLVSAAS